MMAAFASESPPGPASPETADVSRAKGRPRLGRWLDVALILALLLPRLGLAWGVVQEPGRALLTDSHGYLELAASLRTTGAFAASAHEESLRTPVYPAFVALVQTCCGEGPATVVLAQLLLTMGTAALVVATGRALGGEKAGRAAGWLYALNPNGLFWAATVMTETLFAFTLALTAYLAVVGLQRRSRLSLGASGLVLGLGVLTRPIGVYLLPLWILGVAIGLRSERDRRRILQATVLFAALALVPVVGWMTRNQVVHGRAFLSSVGTATFSNYIVGYVLEDALGIPREEAVGLLAQADDRLGFSLQVIREHPMSFLRVTARGIFKTLLGTEAGAWLQAGFGLEHQGSGLVGAIFRGDWQGVTRALGLRADSPGEGLGIVLILWGGVYAAGLFAGVLRGMSRAATIDGARGVAWLLLVSAAYLVLVPLSNGDSRFRVPAEPWLAVLASFGESTVRRKA